MYLDFQLRAVNTVLCCPLAVGCPLFAIIVHYPNNFRSSVQTGDDQHFSASHASSLTNNSKPLRFKLAFCCFSSLPLIRRRGPKEAVESDAGKPAARRHDASSSLALDSGAEQRPKTTGVLKGRGFLLQRKAKINGGITDEQDRHARRRSSFPQLQQDQQQQEALGISRLARTVGASGMLFTALTGSSRESYLRPARQAGSSETHPMSWTLPKTAALTPSTSKTARARCTNQRDEFSIFNKSQENVDTDGHNTMEPLMLPSKGPSTAPAAEAESSDRLVLLDQDDEAGAEEAFQASASNLRITNGPLASTPSHGSGRPPNGSKGCWIRSSAGDPGSAGDPDRTGDYDNGDGSENLPWQDQECENNPRKISPQHTETTLALQSTVKEEEVEAARLHISRTFDARRLDVLPPASLLRPATKDGARRSSVEAAAAALRSPGLPVPSSSVSRGSSCGLTTLSGSVVDKGIGGARSADGGRTVGRSVGELAASYLGTADDSELTGVPVDADIMSTNSQSTVGRPRWGRSGREGGGGGCGGSCGGSSGSIGKRKAATTIRRDRRHRRGGKDALRRRRQPQKHSSAVTASKYDDSCNPEDSIEGSTGLPHTCAPWQRPAELGDLETRADSVHGLQRLGERSTVMWRARNGAASGAGWGGHDQMIRVAADSKASRSCWRQQSGHMSVDNDAVDQRPDTRERFCDADVERLKLLHPCSRCFDALMRYFRDGLDRAALRNQKLWSSAAATMDPHVAFFVRWESLDKDLSRYVPRGFIGSFTPRPFRPALDEYAVRAARDPKFWGLSWAQIPDTRCTVIVVKSMEVAQHESDWLSNRHGLILTFKDSADRDYQSTLFPETIIKAGWSKERTIDALFLKAGYTRKRPPSRAAGGRQSYPAAADPPVGAGGAVAASAKKEVSCGDGGNDPVVARTATFLRFETVSYRMNFRKYQNKRASSRP